MILMKTLSRLIIAAIVVFALLQCIRPAIPSQPTTAEIQAPPEVRQILETHCYACHSDQRRLSWFDEIVPGYWLVRHDILTAREHLNFSTIGAKPAAAQKATLYEAVTMVQLGAMPLPQFVALHRGARVSPDDLNVLKAYLAPWANQPSPAAAPPVSAASPAPPTDLASVQPEPGGFAFDPSFEGWKLISTTDRGDNSTMRLIFGNEIASNAARSGDISPWPAGARFAKIAWQQQTGADGLIHPGNFVQVELMDKDASRYQSSDGWGWGRWRSLDLKPYGSDPAYITECTSCHQPVRGDDYVYTLPISSAAGNAARSEVVNTHAAALPDSLPYSPLGWNAITLFIDPKARTMSVLFGNPTAVAATNPRTALPTPPSYPAGAVLALVTWVQRDDPHWFGARIPDAPQSVEFVQIAAPSQPTTYRRFSAGGLAEDLAPASAAQRRQLILSLPPAALP
jgi:mono/diheme cytochrome c family protein